MPRSTPVLKEKEVSRLVVVFVAAAAAAVAVAVAAAAKGWC